MSNRAFQQHFIDKDLPQAWAQGHKRVILTLPPGAGKTRTSRLVIERLLGLGGWDCWFLAHRKELIEQPAIELRHLNPTVFWPGKPTPLPSVLRIAGRDTLSRRDIQPLNTQVLVIIDECHHAPSSTYLKLLERFTQTYTTVYVLGLTATPYTLSGKAIPGDVIIEPVKPQELFDSGVILEPEIIRAIEPELTGVPIRAGDYDAPELAMRSRKLMGDMVKEIDKWSDGYPVIVRAVSIADSKERVERLRAAGYRAEHLDGETSEHERARVLARLSIGGKRGSGQGIDVLSQVGIVGEGWNNPSDYERVLFMPDLWDGKSYPPIFVPVSLLSDCAPTMSMCLYRQAECRINRPNGDSIETSQGRMAAIPKQFARVVSHSGNWKEHGFLVDHHTFDLQTGAVGGMLRDKSGLLGVRYCSKCLSVWPSTRKVCSCGSELTQPRTAIPEDTAVDMTPIAPKAAVAENDKGRLSYLANLWRRWHTQNQERAAIGKDPVSVAQIRVIYNRQTGKWPSKEDLDKARIIANVSN